MADGDLLQQALGNLTSNAIKYNRDDGSVELRLRKDDGMAELSISNTGQGVAPEERERVFERFYRADRSRGRRVDGVGLGMSLAREIARAHNGDLALTESWEDRTTFTLTLPLVEASDR